MFVIFVFIGVFFLMLFMIKMREANLEKEERKNLDNFESENDEKEN